MQKQNEDTCTGQKGLTTIEAGLRLKQFGKNTVTTKKKVRPLVEFLKKFNSPLLMILIVAAIISFFVGQQTNAAILLVMVLLSVTLDFVNSYRSQKAVDALAARVVTKAKVYRDGHQCAIALQWIVPGDVVFLTAGDVVPADCRVLESKDFFCNQSVLTGESLPVEKAPRSDTAVLSATSPDSHDRIFLGTSVVSGYAYALVERNGQQTEFGKIAQRLLAVEPETDFERGIRQFSVFIMRVTFFLVCFVFIINAVVGRGWFSSFIFAIAIAIGLTPELLPVILSVSLARGAMRMLKNGVIVKHLPAIQSFGSMNVLCTDKTGTLTENKITVVKYTDVWGKSSDDVLHKAYLNSAMHTGVPNPLDTALKEYRTWDMTDVEKIDEIPFDFERRRSSIVVALQQQHLLITQGAPEDVLAICTTYQENGQTRPLTNDIIMRVQQQFQVLSMDGFKVLSVAVKDVHQNHAPYTIAQENAMMLLGFVSFLDPAKVTVKPTLQDLERYGIEIKIITGDHELLTEKICKDIDLPVQGMMKGSEVEAMTDQELQRRVVGTTIFSRVTPETKERIVTQLRKAGKVVGYLGDGINDAPALRAADVGVSVSNAVDVAKETADIILVHKSLRVLKDGVIEGRKTFLNTMKYVKMGLSSNFGNMLSMMIASAFLPFLPMLPTQILLNNFLYDLSQLSLTTDTVDEDETLKPTLWHIQSIRRYMFIIGPVSSLFDLVTFGVLFWTFHLGEHQFQTGWFLESIATQVFVIYVIRTRKIPFLQSRPGKWLVINTLLAVVIAWMIPFLIFSDHFFALTRLNGIVLVTVVGIVAIYLFLVEAVKRWYYRRPDAI